MPVIFKMKKIIFLSLVFMMVVNFILPVYATIEVESVQSLRVAEEDFLDLLMNYKFEDINQVLKQLVVLEKEVEIEEVKILFYTHLAEEIIIYYQILE